MTFVCVCILNFHVRTYIHGNRYNFHSFLALNSSNIISEVPNLNSTFVLILIIIFLSLISSTGDVVEACSAHASMRIPVHMHVLFMAIDEIFIVF